MFRNVHGKFLKTEICLLHSDFVRCMEKNLEKIALRQSNIHGNKIFICIG